MDYKLTKCEIETSINFNDEEKSATIYTCNKSWMKRLEKLCNNSTDIIEIKKDEVSRTYKVPKSWIKVKMPRQISEEKRKIMIQRAKDNFGKLNQDSEI